MTVPSVFIVIGPAGSGKTTIAQKTAKEHNAAYLDKDRVMWPLRRVRAEGNRARSHRPGVQRLLPRQSAAPRVRDTHGRRRGEPAPGPVRRARCPFGAYFDEPDFLTRAAEKFHWPPSATTVVRVRVPQDLLRDRLTRRGLERDQWKLSHWDEYWSVYGSLECAWSGSAVPGLQQRDTPSGRGVMAEPPEQLISASSTRAALTARSMNGPHHS